MSTLADQDSFPRNSTQSAGLTKREYFAVKILTGLLANVNREHIFSSNCEIAVKYADELIHQLNKK